MSAVYILASAGLRFIPEAGTISRLAEKSAVFAGYIFALGFRLRESGAGARLRLATSEAGMAASIQRPVGNLALHLRPGVHRRAR